MPFSRLIPANIAIRISSFKKMKKTQVIGLALILFSYIFWGLIVVTPFLKLDAKTSTLLIAIFFIGSNVFWVGVFLAGKEVLLKNNFIHKLKRWFIKFTSQ